MISDTRHLCIKKLLGAIAAVGFALVLFLAYRMGGLAVVCSTVAILFFGILARANVRGAILGVFAFSLFQALLTRVIFSFDFPDALEQSMLGYKDPLTTAVSFLLVGAAFLALAGHISGSVKLTSLNMAGIIAVYALLNFLEIFNPGKSLIAGVYGAKNNVLPVLMLFAGSLVIRSPDDTVRFVKFIAWFSVVALAYGLYQEVVGMPAFEQFWHSRTVSATSSVYLIFVGDVEFRDPHLATSITMRVPSVFSGYTFYSCIIVAFGIIIYAVGGEFGKGTWKPLRLTVLLLLGLYFLVSMERMAIVMFGVGVLAVHFRRSRQNKHLLRFVFLCGVSLLIIYGAMLALVHIGVDAGNPRLVRIGELTDPFNAGTVTSGRIHGPWAEAANRIKAHPFTGTGTGSGMYTRGAQEQDKPLGTHNEFLHKQLELGVFGLLSFLLMLFFLCRELMREGTAEEEPPSRRAYAAGMVGVLAAYVLCGLVNVPFTYEPGIVFWFLAGAALGRTQDQRSGSEETELHPAALTG